MQPSKLALGLCAALLPAILHAADPPRQPALTKAQQTTLRENVIPAVEAGDPAAILGVLSPFVAKLSEGHQKAADAFLGEQGLPPVSELLSGNRLALIEQNRMKGIPQPQGRELLLTLRGLKDRVEALLAERKTHAAFQDDARLKGFAQYEDRLWSMHVLANRLENSTRMVRYGQQLIEASKKLNAKSLTDADRELLATDFAALNGEVGDMYRELSERTIEARVNRIAYADEVLSSSKDLKERFQAAFVLDLDGDELAKFFERLHSANPLAAQDGTEPAEAKAEAKGKAQQTDDPAADLIARAASVVKYRQSLSDPQLAEKIREQVKHGRQMAGKDFLEKSRLLFTGLHWWFRGRYGMGTDGNGLLKSMLALTSPDAQFGLYMPKEIPKPTDPRQGGQQVPGVDRRHHYVWQFETRTIQTSFNTNTSSDRKSDNRIQQITTFDKFY